MKIKLFTHTDLDGVGSAIIGKLAFNNAIEITYANPKNIDELVTNLLYSSKLENYTHVFITDLSVNPEVASILDNAYKNKQVSHLALIDHHDTAKLLDDKYEWATVTSNYHDGTKTAATELFYDYLQTHFMAYVEDFTATRFVEIVRRYDTWDWEAMGDFEPKQYNDLLTIMGRDRFITKLTREISAYGDKIFLGEYDVEMLEMYQENIDRYVLQMEKNLIKQVFNKRPVGFVFAEQHLSELGNRLAVRNPDVDYIVIVNFKYGSYSLRTIRNDIHVGEIAKKFFNGGGHQKAAGGSFLRYMKNNVLDDLLIAHVFDKENKKGIAL